MSWPPDSITLQSTRAEITAGEYILMATKHNNFPVYSGRYHDTFIYVSKYNIELLGALYIWVIGTNISDYQGEIISYPDAVDDVQTFFPASSPLLWPDWTNIGSQEEIILQHTSDKVLRNNSVLLCKKKNIKYHESRPNKYKQPPPPSDD